MRGNPFVGLMLLVFTLISGCGLARPTSSAPQTLPSPEGTWTLELTQSGGFAGVHLGVEVTSAGQLTATDERSRRTATQTLSADTMDELRRLIAQAAISSAAGKPSSCADCFIYDLVLKSGSGTAQMQADDVTLPTSSTQALITYLRSLRDSALASQP
jgi:hypothetical protein